MKLFIETYGCKTNQVSTEIIAGILLKEGHQLVPLSDAELVILNTCALQPSVERKILRRLSDLRDAGKKVLVAGCMPEVEKDKIVQINPDASIIGVNSITRIPEILEKIRDGFKVTRLSDSPRLMNGYPKARINQAIGVVQIAEGCLENCSFCVDRTTRGTLVSYDPTKILDDIQQCLQEGCVEIHLSAQDIASYGLDTKIRLPAILRKISVLSGKYKVLLGAMNPANVLPILEDLLLAYNHPNIYQFLDLPLQSGSNRLLKDMKRNYTIEEYKIIVASFRDKYPGITLSTDILVGYPGETDDDFAKTIAVLEEIKPDIINVYAYGARPYTKAAASDLPSWKIKERTIELEQLADKISDKRNATWIGWRGECVVSEKADSGFIARNYTYKPIFIERAKLGDIKTVEVTGTYANQLVGH